MRNNKPNVILIIADQWRGDCLGCAGHPDVKTPYFDTLASASKGGIRFRNAISATPTCIPARAAIYTGMAQENHHRVGYADGVRWDYENTLAGTFASAGYQCHCAGKLHVHPLRNSIGYHSVDLHDGYLHYYRRPDVSFYDNQKIADDYTYYLKSELGVDADPTETGIDCNSYVARPWIYPEKYHPTRWVTDKSIDFLRKRDRDKPFFLTISYVRPHPPFDAPELFFEMYRHKKLQKPLIGDWADKKRLETDGRVFDSETGPIDEDLQREAQIGYYASITQIDYELGRLNDVLFSHGLNRSNTIIMFISDHGEMLCDHHLFRKSLPYKGSAGIPFIISASDECIRRATGADNGELVSRTQLQDRVVELRDVMPTLLSLCGIEIPDTVDGKSVFAADWSREYIHGEHLYDGGSCQWIVTERDKFIWFSNNGRKQYFDLLCDPNELHDAINDPKYAERISELEQLLIDELLWREEGFVSDGRLVNGARTTAVLKRSKREI